jgi:hypothetical protein
MLERILMKPKFFTLCMITLLLASCTLPSAITPTPQIELPTIVPTTTVSTGGVITLNNVSFTIPLGVANDAFSEMVPAVSDANNAPWWDVAPEHLKFTLTGYQLQDKFHTPQIRVYPAAEYEQLNPTAAEQIQKVKTIVAGSQLTMETMPVVPFFNAVQQIASKMQVIDFQNGRGIRFVTQYAQYPAPINNRELFYHFQGLTHDGKYYIVATLPVTSSILPEDEKPEAAVPAGGVPIPTTTGPDPAYYEAVTKALEAMYEDSFNPSLFQLDASITVTS